MKTDRYFWATPYKYISSQLVCCYKRPLSTSLEVLVALIISVLGKYKPEPSCFGSETYKFTILFIH